MFDMFGMMGKMKEVQAKLKEAQEKLKDVTVTAESGAGLVKATVNGQRKLIKIEIDPTILNEKDQDMVNDLVVAAVNNAMLTAGERAQEEMKKSTEGLLPNIPGLDLGNFGL
ncbi:YbaB/EbfC family nucleoid-associated protein [Pontibacter cellulosilyticus]|uniref:Nucleoid-associated protein H8S84_04645 n=1 Tax=Pontibacter cellulosilyticus TaxID=1720253 RepID=A0A923SI13_9BACT|nr:YbaB/EbfC family nucleoid-associated protein [Pontibacter cellulosilyticus]MBC5992122.1 YbaB/EbfC family nucleoid-associated protein [Pontibacter cellulosilyticus]